MRDGRSRAEVWLFSRCGYQSQDECDVSTIRHVHVLLREPSQFRRAEDKRGLGFFYLHTYSIVKGAQSLEGLNR